jgi:hypothetical protein
MHRRRHWTGLVPVLMVASAFLSCPSGAQEVSDRTMVGTFFAAFNSGNRSDLLKLSPNLGDGRSQAAAA